MKKRALSMLLALVLVLSLTPAALAYDGRIQAHDELAAAYEEQASSIAQAPAQRNAALLEISPGVTGWTEEIPWSGPVSELETQELYGAAISETQVYQTINALRSTYYEGMYWTDESQKYTLSVPGYDEKDNAYYTLIGYGCVAFCYRLSDAAFGTSLARKVYDFTYDDVRVGDILRVNNNTHSVTVLKKYDDYVVLTEANYNSRVHWDRTMTRAEVMKADYITTRYPANLTSLNVVVDKTAVQPGEQVRVSVKSPLTTTYDIEVWKGARGTGTMDWSATGVAPTASYLLTRYDTGIYTVYVTSRNDDNQIISGTATFRVSDGKPFNAKISTDKSSYSPNETIKISYSADDADSFNLSVWKGAYGAGTLVTSKSGITGSGATWQTTVAGTYTLYLEAVNSKGTDSATCQFTVTDGRPSNVTLTADRSAFVVGEPFYVTVTAADMTGFNVELWEGDYGTGTLNTYKKDFAPNDRVKVTLNSRGRYTVYVEAYNNYGTVSAVMSVVATDAGLPFTDVSANAYYADAVKWAVGKEITNGTGGANFSPNATVKRCEAVTFLWRAMGKPVPSGSKNNFTDVKASDYYFQAVQWAVEKGITTGVTLTEFKPDDPVTRGQMITFLWRAMGKPGATGQGEWYADAEYWARSNSLLIGTSSTYTTNANCPRSDVVYYMWNALT